jgi:DNA-binding PadR family transcriptional regulator
MHRRAEEPISVPNNSKEGVDEDAIDLTLRALALLEHPATALELSRAIRDKFGATASPSRIYVAIGRLWERGHVVVQPMRVRRSGRTLRQTIVTITARGKAAAQAIFNAMAEDEDAARSAASKVATDSEPRRR